MKRAKVISVVTIIGFFGFLGWAYFRSAPQIYGTGAWDGLAIFSFFLSALLTIFGIGYLCYRSVRWVKK